MGNPHAGFDEAGAGNGLSGTAPAFDPTWENLRVRFPRATQPCYFSHNFNTLNYGKKSVKSTRRVFPIFSFSIPDVMVTEFLNIHASDQYLVFQNDISIHAIF